MTRIEGVRTTALLLTLALCVGAAGEDGGWGRSLEEAFRAAARSGRPVLAVFSKSTQGEPGALAEALVHPALVAAGCSFERVWVDARAERSAAERFGVEVPEVLILSWDGRVITRFVVPDGRERIAEPAKLAGQLAGELEAWRKEAAFVSREGAELVGREAPSWRPEGWLRGEPRQVSDARGKVILMRFFTNTCPYCAATMPALETLHRRYAGRGLLVLGFYHPKPYGVHRTLASVQEMLDGWKTTFPIALDTDWRTLNDYWLSGGARTATSASFLIDRKGRVRLVHSGPELHPGGGPGHEECRRAFVQLESAVQFLLDEP
ncbi:MAG: redoxin domain-containing protein [Planctomycetes bacterium]|nr:redoxin domain-containing protein [Planctomycetota bacterium]